MKMSALLILFLCFSPLARANVVGVDVQNFNPTTNGLDFVTVHSSETLTPGVVNFGFFMNYAINSLPNYQATTTQSRTEFQDSLLSSDLNFGVGLMKGWDFGVSFPAALSSDIDSEVSGANFEETGLNEIRINTKVRVYGDNSGGLAFIGSVNLSQIEDNPFEGVGAGPTFNLEVAADTTFGKVAFGGNLGYRIRSQGDPVDPTFQNVPVEPLGNQILASVAASYLLTESDTKLIGEVFSAFPTEDSEFISDREVHSTEMLLGLKHDWNRNLALHVGGGTELYKGAGSPDWRVYAGLNYTIGPLWSKPKRVIVRKSVSRKEYLDDEDIYDGEPPDIEEFVAKDILFAFDKDQINLAFISQLVEFAEYLSKPPGFQKLVIEGHTDSIGSEAYNLDLSRRRANTVKRILVEQGGLDPQRIKAVGYGEAYPVADNGNYQGRALNRRVEFKVVRRGAENFRSNQPVVKLIKKGKPYQKVKKATKEKRFYVEEADFNAAPEREMTFVLKGGLFASGSDRINPAFMSQIRKVAKYLKRYPNFKYIAVGGHTDSQGAAKYNEDLSRRRALSVKRALARASGLSVRKFRSKGFGERLPIATNKTASGRSLNRRVELKIYRD